MKTVKTKKQVRRSVSSLSDSCSEELTATDVSDTSSHFQFSDDDNDDVGTEGASSFHRKVSFGPIHVREFERIVGDHPDCKVGVPLAIGWAFYERKPVSIEEHENDRFLKGKNNMRMTSITRKNILQNVFGIPEEELRSAEKENQKIRQQRETSSKQATAATKTQSAIRGVGKKVRRGSWALLKGMAAAAQSGLMVSPGSISQSHAY